MALTPAERAKRYRDAHKTVTEQRHVTKSVVPRVTAESPDWPPNWMNPAQWRAWMQERRPNYLARLRAEAGTYRTELPQGQHNRVAKPGDTDYEGVATASQVQT